MKSNKVRSVLDNLIVKYDTPDKQQIKTTSVRPRNRSTYTTTVKNRAIWNISETQEFVAEIESERVAYELIDHDPENINSQQNTETPENGGMTTKGWNSDY